MNPPPIEGQPPVPNDPLAVGIPTRLAFDDNPLEPLIYGDGFIAPTPASVLELWDRGLDRSEACACAVASVLAKCPDLIGRFPDPEAAEQCLRQLIESLPATRGASLAACWIGLGRIRESKDQKDEAESCYRTALELQKGAPDTRPDAVEQIALPLIKLLENSDRHEEANQLHNRLRADTLRSREDEGSLSQLRAIALSLFLGGQYAEAETAYRRLVEKRFELSSTHCHLARVFLMTDREADARREVEQAWAAQAAPPDYLPVRIEFLRTLLQMIGSGAWKDQLVKFNGALARPDAHMDWTMQPVLDHLKPRLGPEQFELLTAMLAAIVQKSRITELHANALWRENCGTVGAPPRSSHDRVDQSLPGKCDASHPGCR